MGRNGVRSVEEGLALAEAIAASEALEFRGVQAYEGHLVKVADADERRRRCIAAFAPVLRLAEALATRGLCSTITGGSTATWDCRAGGGRGAGRHIRLHGCHLRRRAHRASSRRSR